MIDNAHLAEAAGEARTKLERVSAASKDTIEGILTFHHDNLI